MEWIQPMEPVLRTDIVQGDAWVHQVKWDGIRGLCYVDKGHLRVFTKNKRERTAFYPELQSLTSLMACESAVFDGEIVSLNPDDKPDFQRMQVRERVNDLKKVGHYAQRYPVRYIVFDMMSRNGTLLTGLPFRERRSILESTLKKSDLIAATDSFTDGKALYEVMKERSWEGIVSKHLDSPYTGGKSHGDWFKTKISKRMLVVLCGLNIKDGFPNSLVLGIDRGEGMIYIGRASIGLTQEHIKLLKEHIPQLIREEPLWKSNLPELRGILWLKPLVTLWVSFMEWTQDGSIRHPKILGFSAEPPAMADGREYVE